MNIKNLFGLIMCMLSMGVSTKEYNYVDYSVEDSFDGGKVSLVLNTSSKELSSSDWVERLFICETAREFYCFSYPAVTFYVPKHGIRRDRRWVENGVFFMVLRKESIEIFGQTRVVWVIKAARGDREDFFYYSERDGLLAFKHVGPEKNQVQFFMITGHSGFPR